jgi:beta-1,4-mannosyltransferase
MRILASPAFANEKVNPYNALLYRHMLAIDDSGSETGKPHIEDYSHKRALGGRYDIVHFHWPDGYVNKRGWLKSLQRALLFATVLFISKLKHSKIVWTVHNAQPHDAFHPGFSRRFMRWFVQRCDGFIFMSDDSKEKFLQLYQPSASAHYATIPHGHYRESYPAAISPAIARQRLGLPADQKVLLFAGMIKPYKNIEGLITLFNDTRPKDYVLVIAGNTESAALAERLRNLAAGNPDIYLFLQFIPDNQLHIYLSAADAVILPYKAILNSGALLLALSFNKPVIAPRLGAFSALQQELGLEWIYCYEGDLSASELRLALDHLPQQERQAQCPLDNYDWKKIAGQTFQFYQRLFHTQTVPRPQIIS